MDTTRVQATRRVRSSHHRVDSKFRFLEYGYGFLCVLFISTFSLLGALIFPLTRKPYYKYIHATLTSVAVGALLANSIFELIPAVRKARLAFRFVLMISGAWNTFS